MEDLALEPRGEHLVLDQPRRAAQRHVDAPRGLGPLALVRRAYAGRDGLGDDDRASGLLGREEVVEVELVDALTDLGWQLHEGEALLPLGLI